MLSANLSSVNAKLTDLRIRILELDSKRKIIEHARTNIAEEETIPEIREKDTIRALRDAFIQQSKESAELSSKYGPEHPKIKALASQMETTRKIYVAEIDGVLATFEKGTAPSSTTSAACGAMMDSQKKEAIELSKIEVEYKPLQRAADQNTKMYGLIASRQKEIDITGPMKTNNVRILERAIVPGVAGASQTGAEPAARAAARPRHRHRAGVRHRGARQHAQDPGRRRTVPGRAGAGSGADHRRRARRRARHRPGTTCANAIWACSWIRSRSRPSVAARSAPTSCSCRRTVRPGRSSSPARARRRGRRPPRSTSASPWRRPADAC